jgi:hypothetical protein
MSPARRSVFRSRVSKPVVRCWGTPTYAAPTTTSNAADHSRRTTLREAVAGVSSARARRVTKTFRHLASTFSDVRNFEWQRDRMHVQDLNHVINGFRDALRDYVSVAGRPAAWGLP